MGSKTVKKMSRSSEEPAAIGYALSRWDVLSV
jgi:hypothetical protein